MNTIIITILTILFLFTSQTKSQDFVKMINSVVSIDSGASRSVNWIDYDNDHDLDLFISTGYRYGDDNFLYRNDNGTFVRILNQPLVEDSLPSDGSSWGDYNNDGFPDLCVVNWWNKINLLYLNTGGGNFVFQASSVVCTQPSNSETCSWGDYDNDGLLDLFVTNSFGQNHRNFLYKNSGGGNFVRIDTGVVGSELAYSRGMNWVDIDNDRDLDIFVCREGNRNEFLYKNNGNGFFTSVTNTPLTTNAGDSWSGSWGDYDNDGDLDVFVTNADNQLNFLFRNDGNFSFTKITNDQIVNEAGYNAVSGWGDYDNDGDLDMFITQAYVGPSLTQKVVNKLYKNLLRESGTASFEKITTGILVNDSGYSYGFAWGDYDNDGDLDIATANTYNENQKNALYRNELSNTIKWMNIKCVGTETNKSAIGVKVRIKANIGGTAVWQMQEIDGQSGYCGQNLLLHFGFGNASVVDSIKVEWPAGGDQYFTNVALNQSVTITENGSLISVDEKKTEITEDYVLHQNFPNPFNPSTVISYKIPAEAHNYASVQLIVYNVMGTEVATLVNQKQSAGSYSVDFNAVNFPSGIYYYKLSTEKFSVTKKMTLLK
ncbi:MAG: FG-GAP-like repeat-containing protein [Bacteroidota bacterium]|nr:FG-GAP-like repeat-containing protein [Bacteroidota bacterium]